MPNLILPYPHSGQIAIREQAKRFNWLSAGRRWRKTTLMMTLAVDTVLAGKAFLWCAPTFDQVRIGWNETRHAAADTFDFKLSTMTVEYEKTGGRIIFRSMDDPDNARGHTADRVGFDEIADIPERAYYEVVRSMLIDTGGDFWGMGTPRGRNWFFREHLAAKDSDDSMSWQVPTLGCEIVDNKLVRNPNPLENPSIPWKEINHLFQTLPIDIFRQEILAQFIEGQGVVFRNILACMGAPLNPDPKDHKGHLIIAGLDWGKQNDFTATSIGCANCKVELARDRFNQIDYTYQYKRIEALWRKWNVSTAIVEVNSIGEPGFEALQRANLPVIAFMTTAATKPPLIENLALTFEQATFQFQADPVWTGELEAYERKTSAVTGRSQYSAPEGLHDDTVMARALMAHGAVSPPWLIY